MEARRRNRHPSPAGIFLAGSLAALLMGGEGNGVELPFDATIDLPGVGESRKVQKEEPFGFLFCLHAMQVGIDQAEMRLVLPPEVRNMGGETSWKGSLGAREESCLNVGLTSRTGIEQWSRPFQAHLEFVYQGMLVTRNIKWSDLGLEDTDFVSKEK